MPRTRSRKLYSSATERRFEEEYGPRRGKLIFGKTVGKVAREQAARNPSGVKIERVKGHWDTNQGGTTFYVEGHLTRVVAKRTHSESHSSAAHHRGPCSPACRRGLIPHRHRRSR